MGYVLAKDLEMCNGCGICETVCSLYHTRECNPKKALVRVIRMQENGNRMAVPMTCMQCQKPFCQAVCPVGAIYRSPETGAILVDGERCIGCSACVYVCPFGAISIEPSKKVASTCDLCGGDPRCVKFCPTSALQYLDTEDVTIKLRRGKASRLLELRELLTQVSKGKPRDSEQYTKVH